MTLTFLADGVENPANLARLADAARLLGGSCADSADGRLIAIENAPGARSIYGRRPLTEAATLAVGHEVRGLTRRILAGADETLVIPTESRRVRTLNVAAAAAVAGWYVDRGSGAQAAAARPEVRRPTLLLVGHDHVEVGSSLRSAAAFGFDEVLLDDRGAGWFDGTAAVRREALAAARRHKNPLRVRRAGLGEAASRHEQVVVVASSGPGLPLSRVRLARGRGQLVVVGAAEDVRDLSAVTATLDLAAVDDPPLRLVASIAMAEIARQVGRRHRRAAPPQLAPAYEAALRPVAGEAELQLDAAELLQY